MTLFYCLIPFNAPRTLFRNSNTGWHIATGERILQQKQFPRTDPYSFIRAGQPWFATEWAADGIMGLADRSGGLRLVIWTFVIAIATVTWFWFHLNWAVNGNFLLACLLAFPMVLTTNLQWLATPRIFGWILMLACIWFFENPGFQNPEAMTHAGQEFSYRPRHAIIAALGTAFWANLQDDFWFAPAVAIIYAISHLLRPLIWNLDGAMERRRARWYMLTAVVALGGSIMNPYGIQLHLNAIQPLLNSGAFAGDADLPSAAQIVLTGGIAAAGGMLALGQKKLAHFLLTVLLLGSALRSGPRLAIAAIVLLPLANGSITDALRRAHDLRTRLRSRLSTFLHQSDRLRLIDARLQGLWLAPVAAGLGFLWLLIPGVAARTGFPPDRFPVYAAEELRNLPRDARLLAPEAYSGYIIYRYHGDRKVFMYGEPDLYGKALTKRFVELMQVQPGWQERLEEFHFTHTLLPRDHPLAAALEQAGWQMLFRDDTAVLFANPFAGDAKMGGPKG